MRTMPRFGCLLFALAAVVVALLFVFRPQDLPPSLVVPPTASATARASAATTINSDVPVACRDFVQGPAFATGTLDQRARGAQAWLESHPGQQASVVFTDELLTEAAARDTQSSSAQDVRIAIEPAGFRLNATAVAIGRFPIKVLLVPQVSGGVARLDMRELDTDGLPFFFRGSVEDTIRKAADPQAWGVRMRVSGIATQRGCAVVWGTA
jgi:hypothetical protein